jgi:hypothetical protein
MSQLPALTSVLGARAHYDLAFQISPIILQGGIAASAQGQMLPITHYTGGAPAANDPPFALYLPLPGSTLLSQSVGMYPFANQAIAANATIQQPLTLSMVMIAPVNRVGGYLSKFHTFSALQRSLAQHNASGGTYIVATPAFMYTDLLLTAMTDITPEIAAEEGNKQVQIQYQLDFIQPIVTLAGAAAAQNALMQKISNGSKITGPPSWSGNSASSPANTPGVTGALGNLAEALATFGESLP